MKRSNITKKLKKLHNTRLALSIVAVLLAAALVGSFFVGGKPAEAPAETTMPATTPGTTIPVVTTAEPTVPQTLLPEPTVPEETATTAAPAEQATEDPKQAENGKENGGEKGGSGALASDSDGAPQPEEPIDAQTEAPTVATAEEPTAASTASAVLETTAAGETEPIESTEPIGQTGERSVMPIIRIVLALCLAADVAVIVILSVQIEKLKKLMKIAAEKKEAYTTTIRKEAEPEAEEGEMINGIAIGKVHNVGRRPSQQDSFGTNPAGDGILAVVADGMGGLSGGDKVSQKVVISMLCQADNIRPGQIDGVLNQMVARVNEEVNRMLGPTGQYKSGSTLVSVLIQNGRCHWISVGDSRIYLYRGGSLIQLNHEHTYAQELMQRAMKGEISFEAVQNDPQKDRLTSFIGMGVLKHIDASLHSLAVAPGDRLLLMSDGVFNTLPEQAMCSILSQYPDVKQAARVMEEQILAAQIPSQDNFTAVILGL